MQLRRHFEFLNPKKDKGKKKTEITKLQFQAYISAGAFTRFTYCLVREWLPNRCIPCPNPRFLFFTELPSSFCNYMEELLFKLCALNTSNEFLPPGIRTQAIVACSGVLGQPPPLFFEFPSGIRQERAAHKNLHPSGSKSVQFVS